MALTEDQVTKLMDLLKILGEKQSFEELWDQIQNLIEEKENLPDQIQPKNEDYIQRMAKVSPLEKILNNPGLVHLAENIFGNLDYVEVCRHINQSAKQILDNPMYWLRKFGSLSKENQKDWTNVIQSAKDSEKENAITPYLKWNLKKDGLADLPCYSNPAVQDVFRKKIWGICNKRRWQSSYEDREIVKILAPLTDNLNAPNKTGWTPIHWAAYKGNTEIVKTLAPFNTSRKHKAGSSTKASTKRIKKF